MFNIIYDRTGESKFVQTTTLDIESHDRDGLLELWLLICALDMPKSRFEILYHRELSEIPNAELDENLAFQIQLSLSTFQRL